MENSPNSAEQNSPIYTQPPAAPSKNGLLKTLVILQLFVIIGLVGAIGYVYYQESQGSEVLNQKKVSSKSDDVSQVEQTEEAVEVGFIRDGEVWVLKGNGEEEQVTKTGGMITDYEFSKDNSKVVYIVGRQNTSNPGYSYQESVSVKYYNFNTRKMSEVYALEPVRIPNSEHTMKISDAGISEDGSTIIYSTNEAIYFYDISSESSRRVYYAPIKDTSNVAESFGYKDFKLSGDGQKAIVKIALYEGSKWGVLDIQSGVMHDLDIIAVGYGMSTEAVWVNNEQLGVFHFTDSFNQNVPYKTIDYTGKEVRELKIGDNYPHYAVSSPDGKFVYGLGYSNLTPGRNFAVSEYLESIIKIELASGEVSEIYSQKNIGSATYSDLRMDSLGNTLYLEKKKLNDKREVESSAIYKLDLTTPNSQPIRVVDDAIFSFVIP